MKRQRSSLPGTSRPPSSLGVAPPLPLAPPG
eukprot:CAMPEP_0194318780 /NCGR_PEP_ID=MMETSP0171-20130528/15332_1 /TAXON_ID=218684 /ORGANISM="Corethron pennatum, Strain L29A3" /LENGTH=30 /DNA_ID= /DNA_START= /DNA_END= /DNA_ORIENTATION=